MIVAIALEDIKSIGNVKESGTVVFKTEEPHEHFSTPFYDVLQAYCQAVDDGHTHMTLDEH